MTDRPPERVTFSIPEDDDLDSEVLDALVEASLYTNRSRFIRAALRGDVDVDLDALDVEHK